MQKIYVLLVICLGCVSFSMAQQPNIDSLLQVVSKPQEDTGKVIAYRMLGGLMTNTNPLKAASYAIQGVALGKKIGFDKGVAGCCLNTAVAYNAAGKLDSALIYIDTAITWSKKVGEPARIALAYLNRADYNRQLQQMKLALRDCDSSMRYAELAKKGDAKARVYQTIGSVYFAQDDFVQSELFYKKGYELYEKDGNKKMMAISLNNLGNVYKHLSQYENSIASYKNAIAMATAINDQNNMQMYYGNLSDVYYYKGDMKEAEAYGLKALEFARLQQNDMQILNAQGFLANAWLKMGRYNDALRAAGESYKLATEMESPDDRQTAADQLAEGYFKTGNFKEAYNYLQISKSLSDTLAKEKYNDEMAEMQTKFNVSEKEKEIQLLAKDKELQQQKLRQQWLMVIAVVAVMLLILIGAWMQVNRNRLKHRMKELELRNRIAADLHDEVGSSLSSIHMLSEMAIQQGNENTHREILSRMSSNAKETMDKMGDIVWMIKPGETEAGSLVQRMERFAFEICSSKNIDVELQLESLVLAKLTMEQRKNIYLIFKEAVNNAVKYSGTQKIVITSTVQNNQLELMVKDFGKGFDSGIIKKGNGLDNMHNRAKELNAMLSIQSDSASGTSVNLAILV